MRIAIGTTVLTKSEVNGHLDGIAVYTKNLIETLPSAGVMPITYSFGEQRQGVSKPQNLGKFSYQAIASVATGLQMRNASRIDSKVNLFHATDHYIPKLTTLPVVATIMDPISLAHPEWVAGKGRRLKNIIFKKTAQWADHVITISNYAAQAIEEHFGIPDSRISVVPLGVNEQYFQQISTKKQLETCARYKVPPGSFIFIGTLQPRKNIERLIQAFLKLPQKTRQKHSLVIIGRNGWASQQLIEKLQQLTEEGQVHWLNYISTQDKCALLQSSIAMVFPSLYEGFGLPVLEAFASNTPVITSNVTSLPEVAGDAAILVNPYSVEQITQAMETLVHDEQLQQELQCKGYKRVADCSWHQTASRTVDVYNAII